MLNMTEFINYSTHERCNIYSSNNFDNLFIVQYIAFLFGNIIIPIIIFIISFNNKHKNNVTLELCGLYDDKNINQFNLKTELSAGTISQTWRRRSSFLIVFGTQLYILISFLICSLNYTFIGITIFFCFYVVIVDIINPGIGRYSIIHNILAFILLTSLVVLTWLITFSFKNPYNNDSIMLPPILSTIIYVSSMIYIVYRYFISKNKFDEINNKNDNIDHSRLNPILCISEYLVVILFTLQFVLYGKKI